jgi:hypothetical protein
MRSNSNSNLRSFFNITSTSRILPAILILTAMIIFIPALSRTDEEQDFDIFRLSVAGEIRDNITEDLNNDGLKDILLVHLKGLQPHQTRWISIFYQSKGGKFSTAPDQSWLVDSTAVIMDIGDVTGDKRKEVCFITPHQFCCYSLKKGFYSSEPETLMGVKGLAVFPSKHSLPVIDFVRDWNGDGYDDVAIFTFEGITIFRRGGDGGFGSEESINIELETSMYRRRREREEASVSGLGASFRVPNLKVMDYNSDGLKDLLALGDERVVVYMGREDGSFSNHPDNEVLFDVRTRREKIEGLADLSLEAADLNGDGYADAVVTKQIAKGLTGFRGVINIFLGGSEGYHKKPDQVIISEGTASAQTLLRDVNGDGRLDLVLPSIKMGITSIIRILVTRSVSVDFNIFLLNRSSRFSERPDYTKEVKFSIDLSGESGSQAMDLEGDYNCDGLSDFVYATEEDELSVYLGVKGDEDRIFSDDPVVEIETDAYGELYAVDLNGDCHSDMIMTYPQDKERKGIMDILVNRGRLK